MVFTDKQYSVARSQATDAMSRDISDKSAGKYEGVRSAEYSFFLPRSFLLCSLATTSACAHSQDRAKAVRLLTQVHSPCVSLANDSVAVMFSEAVVRRVAEGKDSLQKNDHERRVWGERARDILAEADGKLNRFGCKTMALSSTDTAFLVAELVKRGDAAVYTAKSRTLQATARFTETSCEDGPAGYIDIFAEDGTPIVNMVTCNV